MDNREFLKMLESYSAHPLDNVLDWLKRDFRLMESLNRKAEITLYCLDF